MHALKKISFLCAINSFYFLILCYLQKIFHMLAEFLEFLCIYLYQSKQFIVIIVKKMGKMIENYSLQNEIGRGNYSTVFKALNIKTKQEVAIKMVKAQKFKQYPKLEEGTYNQINILTNLQPSPHIIKYYDMLKTVNNFYFVYEYCNGGNLEKVLKQKGKLSEKAALTYFGQIVEAFRVLNKHNIMHRDLKPQNLLLHDGIIKLADFGFCKPLENQDQISKTMLGSPIYMAPQILKGQTYSIKSDIWSLGVVLFRMFYGFCPFQSNNIGKLIMIIQEEDIKIPNEPKASPEVIKLIRRMITKDPKMRAEWSEVFSYEIRNGELYRSPIRDKTPKNTLKKSITLSQTTNSSGVNIPAQPNSARIQQQAPSQLIYNPRQYNNQLRSTYSAKSPFRQNFKKDLLVKNHQKCIQIMSLAISLMSYEQIQALAISYSIVKNVEKQLNNILQSVKRQFQLKNDQPMMKSFIIIVESELSDIKNIMIQCREELRNTLEFSVEVAEIKKKEILKKFTFSLVLQKLQELVVVSRVVDYIMEDLVIRRQTYEKMSRDKLYSNIKAKIQGI